MTRWWHARKPRLIHRDRRTGSAQSRLYLESLEERSLLSSSLGAYGQLPLAFEPNVGQAPAGVGYVAHGAGYAVSLTATQALVALQRSATGSPDVLALHVVGANPDVRAAPQDALPGVSNYLSGSDPSGWHTGVATYAGIRYAGVYPGVDLLYHGDQQQLEYDFIVSPTARPDAIRLQVQGAQSLRVDGQGNLVLHAAAGDVTQKAPVVYQMVNGVRQTVAGRFVLQDGGTVGFAVGAYDHTRPLTIDPSVTVAYSTFYGGGGFDQGKGIAVDQAGNAYVLGETLSNDFPTVNPLQGSLAGNQDVFVLKLNAQGTAVVYATYLGGTNYDQAGGIALGPDGAVTVVGETSSSDFPTANAFQPTLVGSNSNAFVAKLNPQGNALVFSTFLGGHAPNVAYADATDQSGSVYVTGNTWATDFPTLNPYRATRPGSTSAFVTKFSGLGALVYSTYLGGGGFNDGRGIAVDSAGNAYVTGNTGGTDFPIVGGVQPVSGGGDDAFVVKFNNQGNGIAYSTYVGGSGQEQGTGIAVDAPGNIYVTGFTQSSNFPTKAAVQGSYGGNTDAFVTKIAPGGGIVFSTYLGGSGNDKGHGVAFNPKNGDTDVAGETQSTNFPTVSPLQATFGGNDDAFVTILDATGVAKMSTYFGGGQTDLATAIAVDVAGNAYVTGQVQSAAFPTAGAPVQGTLPGGGDTFVTKFAGYTWQASDVAGVGDGTTRILWNTSNGSGDVWSITGATGVSAGPTYGPLAGWYTRATTVGSDGLTRILWTNSSRGAAVWVLNTNGSIQKQATYGGITGWTATDIAVGSDGFTRLLWRTTNGRAAVWTLDANLAYSSSVVFGPLAGWTANSIAAGTDNFLRLLWTNSSGQAALWLLNPNGSVNGALLLGPFTDWSVQDVAVGSDNATRILWTNRNGTATVWRVDNSFSATSGPIYGPYNGWSATRLSDGNDGQVRLLWNNLDGTAALWLMNSDGTFNSAGYFGPF